VKLIPEILLLRLATSETRWTKPSRRQNSYPRCLGNFRQPQSFVLTRGDRRGHVIVDLAGEVRAIARQAKIKKCQTLRQ